MKTNGILTVVALLLLTLLVLACGNSEQTLRPNAVDPNPYAKPQQVPVDPNAPAKLSENAEKKWDEVLTAMKNDPLKNPPPQPAPAPAPAPVPAPAPKPEPAPVPAPGPAPAPAPAPKPSATPALTAARDLTGKWKGSGTYYQLDCVSGERVRKVTMDMTFDIKQTGNTVVVDATRRITKQEPTGDIQGRGLAWKTLKEVKSTYTISRYIWEPTPAGYTEVGRSRNPLSQEQVADFFYLFKGTVSATSMHLESSDNWEKWDFTFTTDLMSGGVKPVPPTNGFYFGHDSDPKAFELTRQK